MACKSKRGVCGKHDCRKCYWKSFASHPKMHFWNWNKNTEDPFTLTRKSGKRCWFICPGCNHELYTYLYCIARGQWCKYCTNQELCGNCDYCHAKSISASRLSPYWNPTKNTDADPDTILKSSIVKYWFYCNECKHDFYRLPNDLVRQINMCPFCANKTMCLEEDCQKCYESTFASHDKAHCWLESNDKSPREVFKGSDYRADFKCDVCNHNFTTRVCSVALRDTWCPYCTSIDFCDKDCDFCNNKSFVNSPYAHMWDKSNPCEPRDVLLKCNDSFKFICNVCDHKFTAVICKVTIAKGTPCPYCRIKKLCGKSDCTFCLNNSIKNFPRIRCWSKKNKKRPEQVRIIETTKYYFDCSDCGKEFNKSIAHIIAGSWCPYCTNKTELKLYNWLDEYFNVKHQPTFKWCKSRASSRRLPYDFLLKDYNIIIELDGQQHFEQVSNWKAPEATQERDMYKMKCALDNGYTVIRLLQLDVWYDRNDWKANLEAAIKEYEYSHLVFISDGNEYECFSHFNGD